MPLFKIFRKENYTAGIWKTEESPEELNRLLPDPGMYKEDLLQLKSPARQLERLAVRVLLFRLLGEQKSIGYCADGSPYLPDDSFRISISHTGGYVAVIVAREAQIGVDVERYGQKVRRISTRFMREDEVVSFYRQDDTWSLLLHWSAKETLFKALHCDQVDFRHHLFIVPFQVGESGCFNAQEFRTAFHHCFTVNYLIGQDFVMTWVCGIAD